MRQRAERVLLEKQSENGKVIDAQEATRGLFISNAGLSFTAFL